MGIFRYFYFFFRFFFSYFVYFSARAFVNVCVCARAWRVCESTFAWMCVCVCDFLAAFCIIFSFQINSAVDLGKPAAAFNRDREQQKLCIEYWSEQKAEWHGMRIQWHDSNGNTNKRVSVSTANDIFLFFSFVVSPSLNNHLNMCVCAMCVRSCFLIAILIALPLILPSVDSRTSHDRRTFPNFAFALPVERSRHKWIFVPIDVI